MKDMSGGLSRVVTTGAAAMILFLAELHGGTDCTEVGYVFGEPSLLAYGECFEGFATDGPVDG